MFHPTLRSSLQGHIRFFIAEFGGCSLFKFSVEFIYSFLRKFALALEHRSRMGHNEIKNVKRHAGWGNRKFVFISILCRENEDRITIN